MPARRNSFELAVKSCAIAERQVERLTTRYNAAAKRAAKTRLAPDNCEVIIAKAALDAAISRASACRMKVRAYQRFK